MGVAIGHGATATVTLVYQWAREQPTDPQTLAAAQTLLDQLPTETLPPHAVLPDCSRMPYRRNPLFVGREANLLALACALRSDGSGVGRTAAVTGMGGVGKTSFATEFIHRYGQFFAGGVFWLSFGDPDRIKGEIASCGGAATLNLRPDFAGLSLDEQVAAVQRVWNSPIPRLLVFDNCEEEEVLAEWRPRTGGCHILITSRRTEWDPALDVITFPLNVLDQAESVSLLQKLCDALSEEVSVRIAATLGYLPLALYLAGSYLRYYRGAVHPDAYLKELDQPHLLQHRSLHGSWIKYRPTDRELDVARVFELSYRCLDTANRIDTLAIALLAHAACFASGEPMLQELLLESLKLSFESIDVFETEDALRRLVELGFLEETTAAFLRMHRLIKAFVQDTVHDRLAIEAVGQTLIERAVVLRENQEFAQLAELHGHLQAIFDALLDRFRQLKDYDSAARILVLRGSLLSKSKQGNQIEANRYLLGQYEQVQAGISDPLMKVFSLSSQGVACQILGNHRLAISRFEQALEIARTLEDAQAESALLGNLGISNAHLGEIERAIGYYREALSVTFEHMSLSEKRLKAKWLMNLGNCYYTQGRADEALMSYEQAKLIVSEVGSKDIEAACLVNCGISYEAVGRFREALPSYEQALAIAREIDARDIEAACLGHIGEYYTILTEFERAHAYLQQALEICREMGLRSREGAVLHSLAELLVDENKLDEAIQRAQEGAEIGYEVGDSQLIGDNNTTLACACLFSGDLISARKAINAAQQQHEPRYNYYVHTLLGIIALRQEDKAGALAAFKLASQFSASLLEHEPGNSKALETQVLVFCGLTLCGEAHLVSTAVKLFREASQLSRNKTLSKRAQRLLEGIMVADTEKMLQEVQHLIQS